ncbi:DUF3159 domain-containing protein [Actinomadura rugatobispora]|uniref:DUF3159 domain-containing protein n=1 Tax=Actinomadura rugatobispora TaxID=1994 RepID=A0ABW1A5T0_9ACTN|nr:hypothetical protein GCM10010200_012100 [Actinomadura rugatobispora]
MSEGPAATGAAAETESAETETAKAETAKAAESADAADAAEGADGGATAAARGGSAHDTVEAAVRAQLSKALGGVRGMVEAAVPTIGFTATYVVTHEVRTAVTVGIGAAVLLLAVRLVQRSNPQFVLNSLLGIAIAAFFALRSGKAEDAFMPGILVNAGYGVAMLVSILARWPVVGFIIGSVTGDPTGWRSDPQILRLCSRLTWILLAPCVLRVVVQYPIYLADGDQSALLGATKIAMGWPLQVAALAVMVWVLARGRTPLRPGPGAR